MKKYDYIIIGAGICGCSLSYFLKQYSKNILLIDKNSDVAFGASGAAGAFLSPLLGKPNEFKSLVTKALKFSLEIYKKDFAEYFQNSGTCRIPKNQEDFDKFKSYIPHMDFDFKAFEDGYFFDIGSVVSSYEICKKLSKDVEKLFNYDVLKIEKKDDLWIINDEIEAKKLFLSTGADISLINEEYFDIRAVWGQKIDILSSTKIDINYHKECSLSKSIPKNGKNFISIGATHHRFKENMKDTSYNLKLKNINNIKHNKKTLEIINSDTEELLKKANDIKKLEDIEVIDIKIGSRASSIDYFPMVGTLVDSKKSFEKYPHIKNGTHIKNENLVLYENIYTLNGVGGRGFVLSLYLASNLVEFVINNKILDDNITNYRLFSRWAKKYKD
ncbi:D-amino-acid oxidase [Arcobacter sp. FW59]|nr:D-amino-acid oxidase [Arcobacter sp. FW59]